MKNKQIEPAEQLIYTSKRPFWHFLLAIPFYIFTISMIFKTIQLFDLEKILEALKFVLAVFFMFVCAVGLTFNKRVYTNALLKNVRFNFTLFRIPLCKDTFFTNVQYISVYKNYSDRDFEVKIWLSNIEKKTVSVHLSKESAFNIASKIASGLEVNLLDATERGNFKWIEKENLNK